MALNCAFEERNRPERMVAGAWNGESWDLPEFLDFALKNKAKILMLQSDTGISGGIAAYISILVRSNAFKTVDCVVSVSDGVGDFERVGELYPSSEIAKVRPTYNIFGLIGYVLNLNRIIKKNKIQIVHAHALRVALCAAISCGLAGIPFVYTNHGLRFAQKSGRFKRITFLLAERFVARRASQYVCVRRTDERIVRHLFRICRARLLTIRTRVPVVNSKPAEPEATSPIILIGVGSLIPVKRPDTFINWVRAILSVGLNVQAVWAGEGPLRTSLLETSAAYNLPIQFPGMLTAEEMARLYSSASLLLLTSDFEVFPLTVVEAAAYGTPTVSTRFLGVSDIVKNGSTGEVLDSRAAPLAAEKIVSLLRDEPRLALMSSNCRKRFYRLHADTEKMAEQYLVAYRQASGNAYVRPL